MNRNDGGKISAAESPRLPSRRLVRTWQMGAARVVRNSNGECVTHRIDSERRRPRRKQMKSVVAAVYGRAARCFVIIIVMADMRVGASRHRGNRALGCGLVGQVAEILRECGREQCKAQQRAAENQG